MDPSRIHPPELFKRGHKRIPSLSPTRSPTRQRITDDILSDLSPTTTLEAFTNPSGKLRASVEAATPSERAFGVRATIASKKIQEWVDELSAWPWPSGEGSEGFEIPAAKRRRISVDERTPRAGYQGHGAGEEEYIGCLQAEDVAQYENRVDDIHEDMDDLNVEEIKSTVLNTHFSPKSRPSSSGSNMPAPSLFATFTRMDDFTAVVTATVLQALPNLSKLTRLMDVWTIRLIVLRKVPPLLRNLEDVEVALKLGWETIEAPARHHNGAEEEGVLERQAFGVMRDGLQEKVTSLGKDLDYMLDTLEGSQDTLPEIWLDRMETIEGDYGEWVVRGDRKVREGEWAKMAKARKADADRIRAENEEREAARLQDEREKAEEEERLLREQEEAAQLEHERLAAAETFRLEQEAEDSRLAEIARKQEEDRIRAMEEAAELEREEKRLLDLEAAESERQAELLRKQEEERTRASEKAARLERERIAAEEALRLEREAELARKREEDTTRVNEAARLERERVAAKEVSRLEREAAEKAELLRRQEEDNSRAIEEATRFEREERLRLDQEAAAEVARKQEEDTARALEEATRLEREEKFRQEEAAAEVARLAHFDSLRVQEEERLKAEEHARFQDSERKRLENEVLSRRRREAAKESVRQAQLARDEEENSKARQAAVEEGLLSESNQQTAKDSPLALQTEGTPRSAATPTQEAIPDQNGDLFQNEFNITASEKSSPPSHDEMLYPVAASAALIGAGAAALLNFGHGKIAHRDDGGLPPSQTPSAQSTNHNNVSDLTGRDKSMDQHIGCLLDEPRVVESSKYLETSSPISRLSPFDGPDEANKGGDALSEALAVIEQPDPHSRDVETVPVISYHPEPTLLPRPETPKSHSVSDRPSSPSTPSMSSGPLTPDALSSPTQSHGTDVNNKQSRPSTPSSVGRIGQGLAKLLRRASSSPKLSRPTSSGTEPLNGSPKTPTRATSSNPMASTPTKAPLASKTPPLPRRKPDPEPIQRKVEDSELVGREMEHSPFIHAESNVSSDLEEKPYLNSHRRNVSEISGYSASDPSPEIFEAEPAEYFRPVLPEIMTETPHAERRNVASPPRSPLMPSGDGNMEDPPSIMDDVDACPTCNDIANPPKTIHEGLLEIARTASLASLETLDPEIGADGAQGSILRISDEEVELKQFTRPVIARKTSITPINSPIRRIDIPRRESTASESTTSFHRQLTNAASSPLTPTFSLSEAGTESDDESSPSKGRDEPQAELLDCRNSHSLPPVPPKSPRRSSLLPSLSFDADEFEGQRNFPIISEDPIFETVFESIEVSEDSVVSNPKKNSDDQIQAQISSILESIPARIRLTSEAANTNFNPSETLRLPKTRRSITPSFRSHSSLSSRAPTPSFTLAPAYGKGTSRPRPQSSNPEIKLYHLSRSTGEVPIKLFVRLVGENGERVMVRVGGGWADLGEYLREYASHHGRRSAVDSDRVEIQDIRPRIASNTSTASTSTIRGINGRSSPVSRPGSSLGPSFERPMSSLHIRKTRRSIGERDSSTLNIRYPSTPLPASSRARETETPPSESMRSVSRMSWTEEEGGLGLAGPKSKKVVISERDEEWVESMKEKVRLASAEKDRKDKNKERKSFGEKDKVGGTKRLFKKG